MPTFDPIRDADQRNQRERPRTTSRVHQEDGHAPTVRVAPAPVRRVSTLAMILNDDAENPPLSAHRVSLSPTVSVSTPHSILSFHQPPFDQPSASAPTTQFPFPLSPSTSSPVILNSPSRPHRPQQIQMLPPPLPPPPPLVYNPTRITPPACILTPLTSQDLDRFQRPDNPLRRALGIPASLLQPGPRAPSPISSRKRSREPDEDDDNMSPKKKKARDDVIVALHCMLSAPIPSSLCSRILRVFSLQQTTRGQKWA